jgi:hypothetical protein
VGQVLKLATYNLSMAVVPSATSNPDSFRRLLPLLIASSLVLLGAVACIGFAAQDHWDGMYLIWGIGIGLLGAANQQLILYVLPRVAGTAWTPTKDQGRSINLRKKFGMMACMVVGIATGAFSAIFDNIALVLFGSVVLFLASVTPYILMPTMIKRLRKRQAG